jgi:hypothetical protein
MLKLSMVEPFKDINGSFVFASRMLFDRIENSSAFAAPQFFMQRLPLPRSGQRLVFIRFVLHARGFCEVRDHARGFRKVRDARINFTQIQRIVREE